MLYNKNFKYYETLYMFISAFMMYLFLPLDHLFNKKKYKYYYVKNYNSLINASF